MAQSNASKAVTQAALAGVATWWSLHTADPGVTGANEGSGTGHARGQTTWAAPNAGTGTTDGSVATLGAAPGTYTHAGLWSAANGGTFHLGVLLPAPETYGSPGTYLLDPTLI